MVVGSGRRGKGLGRFWFVWLGSMMRDRIVVVGGCGLGFRVVPW